jgi:O-antigen ligase
MNIRSIPRGVWVAVAAVCGAAAGVAVASGTVFAIQAIGAIALVAALVTAVVSPRWGLLCVFVSIPLDVYGRVSVGPVTTTAFQLLLVVVLTSWLVRVITGRMTLRLGVAEAAGTLVLIAGLWSLPFSLDRSATLVSCGRIAFDTLLFVACIHLIDTPRLLKRAGLVLSLTVLAVSFYALVQYAFPGSLPGVAMVQGTLERVDIRRVAALYADPNTLGGLTAMATASFLALCVHARSRLQFLTSGAAAGVSALAMIVTFSRGSWIALVLVLPIVALTAPRRRRRLILAGLAAMVLGVAILAPGVITSRIQSAFNIEHDTSAATRYYMYISAVEIARDNPVFGTGLSAFDKAYPAYRRPQTLDYVRKPHEVPVAIVAETGVAGMAGLVVLCWLLVRWLRRHRGRPWTGGESAAAAGLAALLVGSLFEYYLYFQYLWIFAALWVVAGRLGETGEGEIE